MIPMGNWADRIDELESDNYDLREANNRLDDEVTELLFQLDMQRDAILDLEALAREVEDQRDKLRTENAELVNELSSEYNARVALDRDWEGVAECLRERAEKAEFARDRYAEEVVESESELSELKARTEKAELDRDHWQEITQELQGENAEMAADLLSISEEARLNWERANDLETGSISIEESQRLIDQYMSTQARANSWFEIAKGLLRDRDAWIDTAEKHMDRADAAEVVLDEFKSALRTLGRS